jgi:hypothetical protein
MISELGRDKIEFEFDPDMTLSQLTSKGKNFVLFNFGTSLDKTIKPNDSWPITKDHDCRSNFEKC